MNMTAAFYYLQTETGRHDTSCSASLYKLDVLGLQALNDLLTGEDEESFPEWLHQQEAQGTFSGSDCWSARDEAIQQARQTGWLIVNYPKHFPEIEPLVGTLRGVVGISVYDNDGYLSPDACECDHTHEQNQRVCRVCYARFVCNILWSYLYPEPKPQMC